jgi:hypothetical protein
MIRFDDFFDDLPSDPLLSCAIHPIPKNLQEQLPCSPHDGARQQ